jgi:hypothetical protein
MAAPTVIRGGLLTKVAATAARIAEKALAHALEEVVGCFGIGLSRQPHYIERYAASYVQ